MMKFDKIIYALIFLITSCAIKENKYITLQVEPIFDLDANLPIDEVEERLRRLAANLIGEYNCKFNIIKNDDSFNIEIEDGCIGTENFINALKGKSKGELQFYVSSSNENIKELIRNTGYVYECESNSGVYVPFLIGCVADSFKIEEIKLKIQEILKSDEKKIITNSTANEKELWLVEKETFQELDNDEILEAKEFNDELQITFSQQGVVLLNKLIKENEGESLIFTIDDKAFFYLPVTKGLKFEEQMEIKGLHSSELFAVKAGLLSHKFPYYFEVKVAK